MSTQVRAGRASVLAGLAAVAVCATAGCGGSGSTTTASTHSISSTQPAPRPARKSPSRAARRRQAPPLGRTQQVNAGGSSLSVTVRQVIDPLRDSGAPLLPGTRAVGVVLTIRDKRGATYDSTASGDVSIVTSSGMAAPLFIKQGVCQTPLTDFESLIGLGTVRNGCVGFTLPRHARVVAVRFSPHSRRPGTVTWR